MQESLKHQLLREVNHRLKSTLPDASIEIVSLPDLPSVRLGLINSDFPTGPLDADTMNAVIRKPAYWAFCWGSGLATASYILKNPQLVSGKKICDLGTGSGIVAIAAKKAGAREVLACDIDPDALKATELNCHINEVEVSLIDNLDEIVEPVSLMFMADVLYDKNNFALIEVALLRAEELIISDSRINNMADRRFKIFNKMEMLTLPNLGEFDEYKEVTFYSSKKDLSVKGQTQIIDQRIH